MVWVGGAGGGGACVHRCRCRWHRGGTGVVLCPGWAALFWHVQYPRTFLPHSFARLAPWHSSVETHAGVGFTDVGSGTPGTDSSQFTSAHFATWRPAFFARLAAQAARASAAVPGCTCGACGAPLVVAFSGKRQFLELFPQGAGGGGRTRGQRAAAAAAGGHRAGAQDVACTASGSGGEQPARTPTLQARRPSSTATGRQWALPEGWPLPLSTEVGRVGCQRKQGEPMHSRLPARMPCWLHRSPAATPAAPPPLAWPAGGTLCMLRW